MFVAWGYGVYFFFASLMILSVFFVWFLLPETKGLPLEVMDRLFAIRPARKAHDIVMDELRNNYHEDEDADLKKEKDPKADYEERVAQNSSSNSLSDRV